MSTPLIARVVDEPLSVAEHEDAVADKRAGAVVSFQGVVRDHDHGRGVTLLEYEGHPSAAAILREVEAGQRCVRCGACKTGCPVGAIEEA